jgi:hypothetical protein
MMRSALFWGITQRRMVILYRSFGTKYRSHLQGSRSPRKKRELRSHQHSGRSLKSRIVDDYDDDDDDDDDCILCT